MEHERVVGFVGVEFCGHSPQHASGERGQRLLGVWLRDCDVGLA